ncbi:MAG: RNA 2',3'-cyclic phosphodiesterase [Terriglobales bacterium]
MSEGTMRLFVAIELGAELAQRILRLRAPLMTGANAHWSRPEAWHLTLRFLGERPETELPALSAALSRVRRPPFLLHLRGLGVFPPRGRPHRLWIGVADANPAAQLAAAIEQQLAPLGFTPEARPFTPHITLASAGKGSLAPLRAALSPTEPAWGTQEIAEFALFLSRPVRGQFEYDRLGRFPLRP